MHTLFVGGLPPDASAETLRELFGDIGGLTAARVIMGDGGTCRGFGYVTFDNREAVLAARRRDGTTLGPHRLRVAPAR
jgi:RNA recognition motif-containing protein